MELPDANYTQVAKVIFDDFDAELTETCSLEQQFTMEVTGRFAKALPRDFTFSFLSATTDVRLSCMGKLNSEDKITPDCVFMSDDVWGSSRIYHYSASSKKEFRGGVRA